MTGRGISRFDIRDKLGKFAHIALHDPPTPFEPMHRLGHKLARKGLYVKRDDCTELALGGNKVRQMEFYLGDAIVAGADTILIAGVVQSNFVRVAAAAAARFGLDCHIQPSSRVAHNDGLYAESRNVFLGRLLGATLHLGGADEDDGGASVEEMAGIGRDLERQDRRVYWAAAPGQTAPDARSGNHCHEKTLRPALPAVEPRANPACAALLSIIQGIF